MTIKANNNFYCCRDCFSKHRLKKTLFYCTNCGKEVFRTPSEIRKNKHIFCSRSCAAQYNCSHRFHSVGTKLKISQSIKALASEKLSKPVYANCKVCGKEFVIQRDSKGRLKRNSCCSSKCLHKLRSDAGKASYQKLVLENRFQG